MGTGVAGVGVLAWMAALSAYDIRERRLPNWLTLPGAMVVMIAAAAAGRGTPALVGGATLFGFYVVVHLLAPSAMGAGDVKLALGTGALTGALGFDVWVLAAVAAPLLTAVWAVAAIVRHKGSTVPHGPSMCLAAAVAGALAVV